MNGHLDKLVPLFDDAPHNGAKIREVAVQIFDDVNRLEGIRREVFRIIQQAEKYGPDDKVLITPP